LSEAQEYKDSTNPSKIIKFVRQWPIDKMKIDEKTALVLEGGGLRGVFTCGVLDCFMEHGIRFPFTVGVSADSIPVEYASRQGYEKIVVVLTRNRGYAVAQQLMIEL